MQYSYTCFDLEKNRIKTTGQQYLKIHMFTQAVTQLLLSVKWQLQLAIFNPVCKHVKM